MAQDDFTIKLTRDQALVLPDWLHRMIGTAEFDSLVDREQAVWSPLHQIAGTLEASLAEIFMPDYAAIVDPTGIAHAVVRAFRLGNQESRQCCAGEVRQSWAPRHGGRMGNRNCDEVRCTFRPTELVPEPDQ
jgi:hypothetical protein